MLRCTQVQVSVIVLDQDAYQIMAETQLLQIREYSPNTYATLVQAWRYGSKAAFQAAFTLECYKSALENKNKIPVQFDYYCLIRDFPQVAGLLDQAINCLLEDWLCGKLKKHCK